MDRKYVLAERMRRQGLAAPLTHEEDDDYRNIFKRLQPVAPVHFSRPGNPPTLVHRTIFDDAHITGRWRRRQEIVKGRFSQGRVGYVFAEDLERYALAFHKPLTRVKTIHRDILHVIRHSGGISKEQIKEELPYPAGQISAALNRLQVAFLVYEHQIDTDWDTGWLDFATEWFEVEVDGERRIQSVAAVIRTFVHAMVFATMQQLRDWSGINLRLLKGGLHQLEEEGTLVPVQVAGLGEGWVNGDDADDLPPAGIPEGVFVFHKGDFLVRAHMSQLRQRYKGHEVLQYLFVDGEFQGAVLGHWRIGPHDINDILLDIPQAEAKSRRTEVIEAVRRVYSPDTTEILRYQGRPL